MWITILTSTLLAAVVAGWISLVGSERQIETENVIEERKKWRAEIRALSEQVCKAIMAGDEASLQNLQTKFALLLNPHDAQDVAIIDNISIGETTDSKRHANNFIQRITLLLKHDWERSKRDTNLWRQYLERRPDRVKFENYSRGDNHRYRILRSPLQRFFRQY